jgi:dTDP-4-dehydrorhamnose reductase
VKILVLGALGMLGKDLIPLLACQHQIFARDIDDGDITDPHWVLKEIAALKPQAVINAAAYTDVDGCESHRELAYSVNGEGSRNIAAGCAASKARLIHLSTDYVFDGTSCEPYREDDPPRSLNVYGNSKLMGERYIQEIWPDHLIIRTEWLYGHHGRNFVDAILQKARKGEDLRVVDDQRGSPTFTKDLCRALLRLLEMETRGILHVTNSGSCSWYEFARRILQETGMNHIRLTSLNSKELARPAVRPTNSVLNCQRLEQLLGYKMRPWEEALKEYLAGEK